MSRTPEQRALAGKIYAQIVDNPKTHDQSWYSIETDCGTTYCIAGWAVKLAHPDYQFRYVTSSLGLTANEVVTTDGESEFIFVIAMGDLGLDHAEHEYLFDETTTRESCLAFLEALRDGNESLINGIISEDEERSRV